MDKDQIRFKRGFSRLEVAIAGGVLVLLIVIGITSYKAVSVDGKLLKADKDLQTLKSAVMSYWRDHRLMFPNDLGRSLASDESSPNTALLKDPWGTDPKTAGYGFIKAMEPSIGEYFILYTQGPGKDTKPRLNAASQMVEYSGSGIVVSNLPTKKLN